MNRWKHIYEHHPVYDNIREYIMKTIELELEDDFVGLLLQFNQTFIEGEIHDKT